MNEFKLGGLAELELGQRVCRFIKQKFEVFQRDGKLINVISNPTPHEWPYDNFIIVTNVDLSPAAKTYVRLSLEGYIRGWRDFQDEMEKAELVRLEKERLAIESKIKKALRSTLDKTECEICSNRIECLEHNSKDFFYRIYPEDGDRGDSTWKRKPPCAFALTIHEGQIKAWVKNQDWARDWHPVVSGRFGKRLYVTSKLLLREVRDRLRRNFILDKDNDSIQFYWVTWSDTFIKKEK